MIKIISKINKFYNNEFGLIIRNRNQVRKENWDPKIYFIKIKRKVQLINSDIFANSGPFGTLFGFTANTIKKK